MSKLFRDTLLTLDFNLGLYMHANPENPKNRGGDTNKNTNTLELFNPVKNQIRMLENGEWE